MSEFARSFVAMRYLLGVRGADLGLVLEEAPYQGGRSLAAALQNPEQKIRAQALAAVLPALIHALEQRSVT
jgi:hypothetical protein